MMAAVAARELRNGEVVFVGIGLPNLACNLARATHAPRTLIVAQLGPRAFPERVDFVTSPGLRPQGRLRRELRMPGAGPVKVITDKAILEADEATGEMVLAALYPGVSVPDVQAGVGWSLRCRSSLAHVAPPTAQQLRLLRDVLDPKRLFLKQ